MELVGAGPRDDVDLAAACASHFRRVASGLHLELLHGVRRRTQVQRVESRIGIGGSIQQEVICIGTIAANAHGRALPRAPVKRIHVSGLGAVARVCPGYHQHQVNEHAAVEGQVVNCDRLDDFSHGRVGGMESRRDVADFDDVLHYGNLEGKIQCHALAYLKAEALG